MLLTLVSLVMVTAWVMAISLVWALVRRFHRSKPPGRQTVRDKESVELSEVLDLEYRPLCNKRILYLKVVTDLMCFCTYFFNLNVVFTGFLVSYRLSQGLVRLPDLSCNTVSKYDTCDIETKLLLQFTERRIYVCNTHSFQY